MLNLSYTKTPILGEQIKQIDELRTSLLLTTLTPAQEIQLRWQSTISFIHQSFLLSSSPIEVATITSTLENGGKKLSKDQQRILSYKKGVDYIYRNWLGNNTVVKTQDLINIYIEIFPQGRVDHEKDLEKALAYIQVNPEHPIIQSALARMVILNQLPFSGDNELFSCLTALLFLYKNGYDFRRMLTVEEYFSIDQETYRKHLNQISQGKNLTDWLEYMATASVYQLNKLLKQILLIRQETPKTAFFRLTDRQKLILNQLDIPGKKISNKDVQNLFKVSQITSSRDLAHLASLGLIFPVGRGRSTYYTKL